MNIVTNAPIFVGNESDYSFASGKPKKSASAKKEMRKEKRTENKIERSEKREVRQEKRAERRANRKAKYGARPLIGMTKAGVQKFKDKLPKLHRKVKENGEEIFEKQMPDGQVKELTRSAVQAVGTNDFFDKADINTPKEVVQTTMPDGSVDLHKEYDSSETETVADANGTEQVFKKEDVQDDSKFWTSWSTGKKIGVVVGGLAVVGIIGYVIYRSRKKGK